MSVKSQAEAIAASNYDFTKVDPNENPPALLYVEWEDHSSVSPWKSIEDHIKEGKNVPLIRTVGYRIYEDKKVLMLAPSISPSTSGAFSVLTVLKADIKTVSELTKKRSRK